MSLVRAMCSEVQKETTRVSQCSPVEVSDLHEAQATNDAKVK